MIKSFCDKYKEAMNRRDIFAFILTTILITHLIILLLVYLSFSISYPLLFICGFIIFIFIGFIYLKENY